MIKDILIIVIGLFILIGLLVWGYESVETEEPITWGDSAPVAKELPAKLNIKFSTILTK